MSKLEKLLLVVLIVIGSNIRVIYSVDNHPLAWVLFGLLVLMFLLAGKRSAESQK
jgi:hypothetical protein